MSLSSVPVTPGSGAPIATDLIDGKHLQLTKVAFGGEGDVELVTEETPLPVAITNLPSTQPVSGPVTDEQLRAAPISVQSNFVDTLGNAIPNFESLPVVYAYDGDGKLSTETITAGADTYVRTYGYTADKLTSVSGWVAA